MYKIKQYIKFISTIIFQMFLNKKPFYFITDRQTNYTYFVNKNNKYVYLPNQFEALSDKQIEKQKIKYIRKFLFWAVFNPKSMYPTDYRIALSKIIDIGSTFVFGLIGGRVLRRFFRRIDLPFVQLFLQDRLLNKNQCITILSYGIFLGTAYRISGKLIKEKYLYDLALEYKYNFEKELVCDSCQQQYKLQCKMRYKQ